MSISGYIKDDLKARLATGDALPSPMTLEVLARMYEVSTTPVRAAINELVDEGLLQKGENRRLTPVANRLSRNRRNGRRPAPLPEPPRDLLKDISYDLVQLSLTGEELQIREEATAAKFNVSRSAIRHIFHRLAGSGLLEHVPRRGWVLRPFRQKDMQAFLEVREVLELKALKEARPHLEDADLHRLLNGNRLPESDDDPPLIDNSLHAYIIEKAGNWYIKDFFLRQGQYYEILFDWEDLDRDAAIGTVEQHREILEAILERKWRVARKALSWHIRCNHPVITELMSRRRE